ncbi:hypothetical protein PENSTE_c002G06974 [Penicillium steckii]|uniref:Uncharacterized protein n=1 Tax=Penicillium steckii TaxID=303698 RepID=A0A1V6TVR9_9EURO|nr:hypothetical protein PENSTE_c002G06974 [Penicillium steckii]
MCLTSCLGIVEPCAWQPLGQMMNTRILFETSDPIRVSPSDACWRELAQTPGKSSDSFWIRLRTEAECGCFEGGGPSCYSAAVVVVEEDDQEQGMNVVSLVMLGSTTLYVGLEAIIKSPTSFLASLFLRGIAQLMDMGFSSPLHSRILETLLLPGDSGKL